MTQATQRLDKEAASIAGKLLVRLKPYSLAWQDFQDIFPEILDELKEVNDPAKLRKAFSATVAKSVRDLINQRTEGSLLAALKKVKALRSLLARDEEKSQSRHPYWF